LIKSADNEVPTRTAREQGEMIEQRYPPGWDAERVKRLIDHYDWMSDEEMIAEDEAAAEAKEDEVVITVPKALLPEIKKLVAGYKGA
jgi:hypothetical protein